MALPLPSADPQPLTGGLHRTDAFHREPLFAVKGADGSGRPLVVRSWAEAHALHGPARPEDVNPAYVAALMRERHDAALAPYRRIQRLPRAHHVWIDPEGGVHASPYDPLAGGAEPMAAEELHGYLRQGLLDQLHRAMVGQEGPIGCEHSSGLDSNAVVGGLLHGAGVSPDRLHTWSLETGGEGPLLEQFRAFHGVLPGHCHRGDPSELWRDPEGHGQTQLEVYGAPPQIGGNGSAADVLSRQGCRLLFSGFGGDQALSHNANNVPTDLVAQGRWGELVGWVGSRRQALKIAAGRTMALRHRPWAEGRVWGQTRALGGSDLLERTLTAEGKRELGPHLKHNYPWELDGYLRQGESIRHRVLADWVAVRVEEESRMAAAHGMAMAFPLLDTRLIGTLLLQEPLLFGEGQRRGRLLHRQAFAPFLPPLLRADPSKARAIGEELQAWREQITRNRRQTLAHQLTQAGDWHPALGRWWDLGAIRREGEAIVAQTDPPQLEVNGTQQAIGTIAVLNQWWQALDG
jgi:asparagine synthetase B (glutamine-hydrolysing)